MKIHLVLKPEFRQERPAREKSVPKPQAAASSGKKSVVSEELKEDYIDIVRVLCREDVDVIMQTLGVINPYILKEDQKEKYDKYQNILVKALEEDDLVFIYRGYDDSCFSVEGSLTGKIYNIAKACGYDISYNLTKLDNEANLSSFASSIV